MSTAFTDREQERLNLDESRLDGYRARYWDLQAEMEELSQDDYEGALGEDLMAKQTALLSVLEDAGVSP